MTDFFCHVDNGTIIAKNIRRGSVYNGKKFGSLSPDSTYISFGLYPKVTIKPAYDPLIQRLSAPVYSIVGETVEEVYTVIDKDVQEVKDLMIRDLGRVEDEKEAEGITLSTGEFMCTDDKSQAKLTQAADACRADGTLTFNWKLCPGSFKAVTAAELLVMNDELIAYVRVCLEREKNHTDNINACTTLDELKNIDIYDGWDINTPI